MQKEIDGHISDELKQDLTDIELCSEIEKAHVIDVKYPNKKVNYNEEFEIELVVELLNDNKDSIKINCPSLDSYENSTLNLIQKHTGVSIDKFAEENVELPVKYVDNKLEIDCDVFNTQDEDNMRFMFTQSDLHWVFLFSIFYTLAINVYYELDLVLVFIVYSLYIVYSNELDELDL